MKTPGFQCETCYEIVNDTIQTFLFGFRVQRRHFQPTTTVDGDKRFDIFEEMNHHIIMIMMCEQSDLLPQIKSMRRQCSGSL